MFTFKYRPVGTKTWTVPGARKPNKTVDFAHRAADKWAADMLAEGCEVETQVYSLVSDGRSGLVEGSVA